ncbi:MAG TPA: fibronectin type III domain-containing protein, partial [Ignavibacteria bacterium]|nr:fibronectin type III domain-containing protein [Ignavibacteria bacterium]
AKYNPLGDSVWRKDYDGSGNGFDKAFSISVNNSSEVFVTGTSSSSGVNYNILTLKYTQSPQTAPVNLTALGVSNTKINLTWSDLNNNETGFKIERSTNGGINWTLKDSVPSASLNYTDSGLTMNTIYHYRIFSYNSQGISGYSNIAFDTTLNLTPVTNINSAARVFRLFDNYPNPFNPETNISFTVPVKTNVKITIYDIAGKEVSTVLNGIMIPGEHTIIFNGNALASGVYFYRMDAGYFYDVKKMILVK